MTLHAKVTLTALNGNISPSERVLNLDENTAIVPVGRASKSISKGLFSAADNAWFDSPVMSREHAQITLDADNKTISITDIGSMHSTYKNDVELPRNTAIIIDVGDILVFGAEVRRGPETFPACGFKVNVEYTEIRPTSTFAFPESSDIDDGEAEGEDYEFSEDEQADQHEPSHDSKPSLEAPVPNSTRDNAIDLTRNNVTDMKQAHFIDLTDEQETTHIHDNNSVPVMLRSLGQALVVPSEDEDGGYSSDSSCPSEHMSKDPDSSQNCINHKDEFGLIEDSDIQSEDMEMNEPSVDSSVEDEDSSSDEAEKASITFGPRYTHADFENLNVPLSDVRTRHQASQSIAEEDDDHDEDAVGRESDFNFLGGTGIKTLFSEDYHSEIELGTSSSDNEPQSEPERQADVEVMEWSDEDLEVLEPQAQMQPVLPPWKAPVDRLAAYRTMQNFTGHKLEISTPILRQPSPSDAAMVKTANTQVSESAVRVGLCDAISIQDSVQSLGEKTGKSAFFEAREVNKAKINEKARSVKFGPTQPAKTHIPGPPISPIPSTPEANGDRSEYDFGGSCGGSSSTSHLPGSDFREPCSFLYKPDHMPAAPRAPSPQFDMTSAHSFHMSKINGVAQSSSRGIKINDIIETSTPSQRTMKSKRKAGEISEVGDEELRLWAKSSSSNAIQPHEPKKTTGATSIASNEVSHLVSAHETAVEPRPTKRMRKFLENVGYVALGGVTVGAGLFTVLVATAPDLL